MEITGKIIIKCEPQSGTSKAGNSWTKQEYVLETMDAYPKKVHFDFFGDRVNQYPLNVGQIITLSFDIESREYNGRWYTSIRGWKAEDASTAPAQQVPPTQPNAQPNTQPNTPVTNEPAPDFGGGAVDDLPF